MLDSFHSQFNAVVEQTRAKCCLTYKLSVSRFCVWTRVLYETQIFGTTQHHDRIELGRIEVSDSEICMYVCMRPPHWAHPKTFNIRSNFKESFWWYRRRASAAFQVGNRRIIFISGLSNSRGRWFFPRDAFPERCAAFSSCMRWATVTPSRNLLILLTIQSRADFTTLNKNFKNSAPGISTHDARA